MLTSTNVYVSALWHFFPLSINSVFWTYPTSFMVEVFEQRTLTEPNSTDVTFRLLHKTVDILWSSFSHSLIQLSCSCLSCRAGFYTKGPIKKSHKEKHHTMKEKLVQWLEKRPITQRSVLPTALFNHTIAKSQLEVQENIQCSSIFFLLGKLFRSIKTAAVAVSTPLPVYVLTNQSHS